MPPPRKAVSHVRGAKHGGPFLHFVGTDVQVCHGSATSRRKAGTLEQIRESASSKALPKVAMTSSL